MARLQEALPTGEILEARNQCLQRAASKVQGGPWAKARTLAWEILRARAVGLVASAWPPNGTPAGEVAAALMVDPECPVTPRHLLRLLSG